MVQSGGIRRRCGLGDILQEIVATEQVLPCAVGPAGHLVDIEVFQQKTTRGTRGEIVAGTTAVIGQIFRTRHHIDIQTIGIQLQLIGIGEELTGTDLVDRLFVQQVTTGTQGQGGYCQPENYFLHV